MAQVEHEVLCVALAQLPARRREALIAVGIAGFSYEETAKRCGCPEGTIKSRVNRARERSSPNCWQSRAQKISEPIR